MKNTILIEKIVSWLKDQVQISKSKGLLLGVSGGIDSAVVANLIKKACPDNSLAVIMPISSSEKSLEDAQKLVDQCKIKSVSIDLTNIHKYMLDIIFSKLEKEKLLKDDYKQMTDANLKTRLRMSSLYTIANNLGYMVVGTDNKNEMYTGYFTKYGDGGVDILPLANIFKSQVYDMAKILGIPQSIIDKAPSADLWEDQTDEEEMGVKYWQIEKHILGEKISEEAKKTIERLHLSTEHKRKLPPKFEI